MTNVVALRPTNTLGAAEARYQNRQRIIPRQSDRLRHPAVSDESGLAELADVAAAVRQVARLLAEIPSVDDRLDITSRLYDGLAARIDRLAQGGSLQR